MKRILIPFFIALIWLAASPLRAAAQTPSPPADEQITWTGEVTGTVLNVNQPDEAVGPTALMLHVWDQNFNEATMLHGETEADGSFRFEEVPFQEGYFYAVMASYQEASYFSDPAVLAAGETSLQIEVPVYESKTDLEGVQIDQLHVLFFFTQGGVGITEVYILSNLSERTVRDAVTIDGSDDTATVKFFLPPEAANVTFNSDDGERFVRFPGGFADRQPIVPGEESAQIAVNYILPYEDSLTYTLQPPLDTTNVNFLLAADAGVSIKGETLVSRGVQQLPDGTPLAIYQAGELQAGERVQVFLSGEPQVPAAAAAAGDTSIGVPSRQELAWGGIALGLALIGLGIWWYRRQEQAEPEALAVPEEAGLEWLIAEIVQLDKAYEQGEIDGESYHLRRAALKQQAKTLLSSPFQPEEKGA